MHGLPGSINQTQYLDRFSVRTVKIDIYENTHVKATWMDREPCASLLPAQTTAPAFIVVAWKQALRCMSHELCAPACQDGGLPGMYCMPCFFY